jgi:hypothetical protein
VAGFALMAGIALFVLRRPEEGERAAAQARPVAALGPGGLDELEVVVARKAARTTVRSIDGKFWVMAPVEYPANQDGARAAFEALERLSFSSLVTDRQARHAELEVDDAKGAHVIARKRGRPLLELVVGKTIEAEHTTMVRLAGSNDVWQVQGELHDVFDKSTDDWRDRRIAPFEGRNAEKIEVTTPDGSRIVMRKTGQGSGPRVPWEVVEASFDVGKLDSVMANHLVESMSSLTAAGFADGANLRDTGLEPPAVTVTVHVTGGETDTLLVGKSDGKHHVFVKNPALPQIFLAHDFDIDRAGRRPIQFRDRTLCDINDGDIVAYSVTDGADSYAVAKRDGAWRATAPAGFVADPDKVTPLATVFRGWVAPEIAEAPPADAMQPLRAVIVGRSKKASCTIQVGGEPKNHEPAYYVRTPTSRNIYVVPKWMVDRIAVRLDQISKT